MNKNMFAVLLLAATFFVTIKVQASNPVPKPRQQPSNCIKQPEIVKKTVVVKPEPKVNVEKSKPASIVKTHTDKDQNTNSIPHFSIFNFFNSFYTKDTLDRLQVM